VSPRILKPLFALALCTALPLAWAGQTLMYIADDMAGLPAALELAGTAAIATQDTPIVLIIKDTQVSQALSGGPNERALREGLADKIRIFVCEADLVRYGIGATKVYPGISIIKAPVKKSDGAAPAAAQAQPLERFRKQAEKVCDE
jgi:intracellular sulfur oxidation DsrE/DsrF family protein